MNFLNNYTALRRILPLLALIFLSNSVKAQLSGVKMIPMDYTSIAAFVTDLNLQGVGPGGVTLNVPGGYTETLTARINITATGTAANPIVIQRLLGGGSNPLLTAYVGTATPSSTVARDGFISLQGSDYVTIDGIDMQESAANLDVTTQMEFGIILFKNSATDGAQFNTIKNCNITLNRNSNTTWNGVGNDGSVGIGVYNCTPSVNTAIVPTSADGTNSNNKIYSNTVQNCNVGISLIAYTAPSPFTLGDQNNDIGGSSIATGNSVLNFGGATAATNPCVGIFANNQWGLNVSYNTVNNNNGSGVNHVSTMRGIFLNSSSAGASVNCNNNNVTVKSGATTSQLSGIENSFGSTPATNTVNIKNNTVTGSYLTATTGNFYGIYNTGAPTNLNITGNSVSNFTYSTAANAGSGINYYIYSSGGAAAINIRNNTVNNNTRLGTTGGTTYAVYTTSAAAGGTATMKNNLFSNFNTPSGTIYGLYLSTGTIVCDSNEVSNINYTLSTGASSFYGIYNFGSPTNENYNYNKIYNIQHAGTGSLYGLYINTTTGVRTVSNNNLYNWTTGGNLIYGMYQASSSPTIFNNKINSLTANGGTALIYGLYLVSVGTAGTANVYNNIIGNLYTPNSVSLATAPSIRGIFSAVTTATSTVNVRYNTVYLNATSTGVNFATAGLYQTGSTTATTGTLNFNNNNIINNSTQKGTGLTMAICHSIASPTNFVSNRNNLVASSPSATNVIYYNGTTSAQTLANYQTLMAPQDALSVSEAVVFMSTTPTNANYLHIAAGTQSLLESAGLAIAGINNDIDGDVRFGSAGYAGTGTGTDIGADEFNGLIVPNCSGTPVAGTISGTAAVCSGNGTILSLSGQTYALGITYQWKSSAVAGGPYTNAGVGTAYATGPQTANVYYIMTATCANSGLSASTTEFTFTVNPNPPVAIVAGTANVCLGSTTTLTASGANTYAWTPAATLSSATASVVTATPTAGITYSVTGTTTATGCFATATQAISVLNVPSISTTTATPAAVCSGASSQLLVTPGSPSASAMVFSTTAGTFTNLVGGTVLGTNLNDDDLFLNLPIGFTFNYNGASYTTFSAVANGFIAMGATVANSYTSLSSGTTNNVIAAFNNDLQSTATGQMSYATTGTAPNRVLTVEYKGYQRYSTGAGDNLNFQIKLYEGSDEIRVVYGTMLKNATSEVFQVGLRGTTNADFNNRSVTTDWVASAQGGTNAATCTLSTTVFPPSGRTYIWSKPTYTYAWSPSANLSNATITNPVASNITANTTYTATVTSSNGCTATGTAAITSGAALTSSSAITPAATVCAGTTVTLTATPIGGGGPYTYAWSGPGSFTSTVQSPTRVASTTTAGTYTCLITDACLATSTQTKTLVVNTLPTTSTTPATSANYCSGTPALAISVTGADTYAWSPATGLSAATGSSVGANPTGTTTYIVTGTTTATGCTFNDTIVVNYGAPVAMGTVTATPAIICANSTSTLAAVASPNIAYCTPTYSSGTAFGDYISKVQLGTINNVTVGAATPYYTLYPATGTTTTTLTAGSSYTITLTAGTYTQNDIAAWIDYNQNGNLEDAGEKLGQTDNMGATPASTSYTFTVPANAANGKVRLRVREIDGSVPGAMSPCTVQSSYGEVEDYDITIVGGQNNLSYTWATSPSLPVTNTASVTTSAIAATTTFNVTASSALGCTATGSVAVTVNQPSTTTISPVVCGSYTSPLGAVWTTSGTHVVTLANVLGCDSIVTINLTVNPLPAVNAGLDISVCSGFTATLAGSGATSYTWNNGISNNVAFTPTTTGTYTVTGTDANGCINTDQAVVTVLALPIVNAGPDVTTCQGQNVTLSAYTVGTTPTWSSNVINGFAFTPTVGSTVYTVSTTNTVGCSATDAVTVNVTPAPTVVLSADQSVCTGTPAIFTASVTNGSQGTWSTDGFGTITPNTANTSVYYTPSANDAAMVHIYYATLAFCGSASDTAMVTVKQTPVVNAGADLSVCSGSSATLTASGADTYVWTNAAVNGQSFVPTATTTYTVTGTNANGCSATDAATVTVNAMPNAVATASDALNIHATPVFGAEYQWINCANNQVIPGATSDSYAAKVNGSYAVVVTNASGCSDTSACVIINTVGLDNVLAENSVTLYPNPTTGNLFVQMNAIETINAIVYDAQGKLIATINNLKNGSIIDLTSVETGIYMIHLNAENASMIQRVIKN